MRKRHAVTSRFVSHSYKARFCFHHLHGFLCSELLIIISHNNGN